MNWNQLRSLFGCLFLATVAPAAVPDYVDANGFTDAGQLSFWVVHRLRDTDYSQVDEALLKFADLGIRDVDGKPALGGIEQGVYRYAAKEALGVHALDQVQKWRENSPRSVTGILVESRLWYAAAWAARGPGTADHVSDEGWRLFRERLSKAETVLRQGHDAAASSPMWYSMYMDATLGLQAHDDDAEKYFREGIAKFPDYYEIYFAYLLRKLPKWGGSEEELFAAIDEITHHGRSDADAVLYARLIWSANKGLRFEDGWITDHGADWPTMRRGFDLIHAKFARSTWNAANFLAFACHAKDRESYRQWRTVLGADVERYTADLDVDVAACDRRLRPMSKAQEQYERHMDALGNINARLIRACFAPMDGPAVTDGFRQLLAWRRTLFELIQREKPEEVSPLIPAPGTLEAVEAGDPNAVCGALKFGP
jgi:hypothetical protein